MKKVFLSLAAITIVATGSLTVTSCGGDDSTPGPVVDNSLKLAVTTPAGDIVAGEVFEMTIKKADGTPVEGAELQIDGENLDIQSDENGIFSLQGPAGEYVFTAEYEGTTSNEVTVVIQEAEVIPSEGTGTFTYEGTTYNIENSVVVFRGLFYKDATQTDVIASWQIESVSGNYTAIARFNTPATPAGGDMYNYEEPNTTNTTGIVTGVFVGTTLGGQSNTNVVIDFDAPFTNDFFEGTYSATSDAINGSPFSLNFDGKTPRVDSAQKPAAKGATVKYADFLSNGNTIKAGKLSVQETKITKM